MPMTWGWLRPVVLLPIDSKSWPVERRRVVLLHELAHVKRLDCLTQQLAQLSCAVYWFNPLSWWAGFRMMVERERACDDLVLLLGSRPSEYAGHLLVLAREQRGKRGLSMAAVAMARGANLEGRLRAILDPRPAPRGLRRWGCARAVCSGPRRSSYRWPASSSKQRWPRRGPVPLHRKPSRRPSEVACSTQTAGPSPVRTWSCWQRFFDG